MRVLGWSRRDAELCLLCAETYSLRFVKLDHASGLVSKLVTAFDVVAGRCRLIWFFLIKLLIGPKAAFVLFDSRTRWTSLLVSSLKIKGI